MGHQEIQSHYYDNAFKQHLKLLVKQYGFFQWLTSQEQMSIKKSILYMITMSKSENQIAKNHKFILQKTLKNAHKLPQT